MLKLLQSLFGAGPGTAAAYPDTLVDAVIERAVDGTDPRLRVLGSYRRRLREPALATIDHVMRLVDALPAPVAADAEGYRNDPGLCAMFASLERLQEVLGKDANLEAARRAHPVAERFTALLVAEVTEKHVLGLDLENDQVKRDVQQTVLSFDGHRLLDPDPAEEQCRRALKRRAFDFMLAQVLQEMSERTDTRRQLSSQRALLRRKLEALRAAGWSLGDASADAAPDLAALESRLAGIEEELQALGSDGETLDAHLGMLADALAEPATRLRSEARSLRLDNRNVLREAADDAAREITLHELRDVRGARVVVRMVLVDPATLPRTDFFKAASRYL
jgi:hypothetical protein